jgi:hypothetical protein
MSDIEAIAKAVEKSADFGTQALQTGEKAGGFFARVFQEPIEAGVGILTDRLKVARLKKWDQMADEIDEILSRRGISDTRPVSPKLGIPLLENAGIEDEPEIQKLWTNLLANAMDPSFLEEVRIAYVEIIKGMSPLDAKLLLSMYNSLNVADRSKVDVATSRPFYRSQVCAGLNLTEDSYALSTDNLLRLQCIVPYARRAALGNGLKASGGEVFLSVESRSPAIAITSLGLRLVEACTSRGLHNDSVIFEVGTNFTYTVDSSLDLQPANLR